MVGPPLSTVSALRILLFTSHLLTLCVAHTSTWRPRNGSFLPLEFGEFDITSGPARTLHERSRSLGEAKMPLLGHVLTRGYYYTNLWVGTPSPQRFSLIVDTGSTVTYVPCSTCKECGVHQSCYKVEIEIADSDWLLGHVCEQDSPFLPSASSSYEPISCQSTSCIQSQCDKEQRCLYTRHYAENSSSSGVLASDIISLGDASTILNARITFGCEMRETGDLYTQKVDGILGMGKGPLGIVDQLTQLKAMDEVFSLCYGGADTGGGAMMLGSVDLPAGMVYSSFNPARSFSSYYNIVLDGIRVAGKRLPLDPSVFDKGYGAVLDSGTTFAYLPAPAFTAFQAAVEASLGPEMHSVAGPYSNYHDICWGGASSDSALLSQHFPQVDLELGGGVIYQLAPENYLFRHRKVEGSYCLGLFQHADEGTLLGGILVRNTLVTYNRVEKRVGFYKTDCSSLSSAAPVSGGGEDVPEKQGQPLPDDTSPPPHNPSPPTQPDEAASSKSDAGCEGCASEIEVAMTLGTDLNTFKNLIPEFVDDLVRELSVDASQVELEEYREENAEVHLYVDIVPYQPQTFIPSVQAQRIKGLLLNRNIGLRDAFGSYSITSVQLIPISQGGFQFSWWMYLLVCTGGVLVVGGVVAGGLWWWRRRQMLLANKYTTMDQLGGEGTEEEEMALGGGEDSL